MITASFFPKPDVPRAMRGARRPSRRWFSVKHSWILATLALQSACSLLIKVDDGVDDDPSHGGSSNEPDAATPPDSGTSGAGSVGVGGSAGVAGSAGFGASGPVASERDAGLPDADSGDPGEPPPPPFDLAFIENPAESGATLRLVSAELALRSPEPEANPPWRISLRPADQAGDALDFAWSPDGQRIAVRYVAVRGTRVAFFAAPEWQELAREEGGSPTTLPDLDATANYRWSPSGDAFAVELTGADTPLVSGYVIEGDGAFGLEPVAFTGPIETMDWLSASSLFVIQPQDDEPEVIELRLNERTFEPPASLFAIGLFFPLELGHVPGGIVAASADPENFVNFWPESPELGAGASFLPSSYLSSTRTFAAEIDSGATANIHRIGDSLSAVASVPDCPTLLAWMNGPDPSSLAGSKLACLGVQNEAATISLHTYSEDGSFLPAAVNDQGLLADFVSTADWEGHARGFSPGGEFLALATAAHDAVIDLRGSSPTVQIADSAVPGNSARGFSPSGRFLLQQRGRNVQFVVLSPVGNLAPLPFELPEAFVDLAPCATAHHVPDWCGAPSAARHAAARWSVGSDVAALLAAGEGLEVLAASTDPLRVVHVPVSTCGASCVTQYEFGR
jgi:hypothetical protein